MQELQNPDSSNANALALVVLVIVSIVVFFARPRYAVAGLLLTALFIPLGQQFVIAGLHFRFYRILILVGLLRGVMPSGGGRIERTRLDTLVVAWALVCLICGLLRGPKAEMFGAAYDVLGGYFVFRLLIVKGEDVTWSIKVLAVGGILLAACMFVEWRTTRNPFFVFGGVPEFTFMREGRSRCQGPFRHPILAGTFAASLFPLLVGLWQGQRRSRALALLAIAGCTFASYVAASGGALMTLLSAVAGLALWPMRRRMTVLRYTAICVIVAFAVVMKPPVWYILAKISALSGGTGWHRAYIIDQAVSHLGEWWLIGSSRTAHWASDPMTILAIDPENMDITNFYIRQGLNGGVLGLGLFVSIVVCCFKIIGRAVREKGGPHLNSQVVWALGVGLAAHCAAFISVSYFDQILVFWIWLIAAIAAIPAALARESVPRANERIGRRACAPVS